MYCVSTAAELRIDRVFCSVVGSMNGHLTNGMSRFEHLLSSGLGSYIRERYHDTLLMLVTFITC